MNKRVKTVVSLLAVVASVAVCVSPLLDAIALAAPEDQASIYREPIEQVSLYYEGKLLPTAGYLVNETAVVSLKDISIGLDLSYRRPSDYEATAELGNKKVTFYLGSDRALINGHEVWAGSLSTVTDDIVTVPLRFLVENLGFRIKWTDSPEYRIDLIPVVENSLNIGTVRERQESATLDIDIQYPRVTSADPALESTLAQANAYFAERTARSLQAGYESEKNNKDYYAELGYPGWPTDVTLNYTVTYNQKNLLSIIFDDYIYTGGAHGGTVREGYTLDLTTGTKYALADLFAPGTDYVSLLSAEVKKQIEERELGTLGEFTAIRADQDFYIKDDTLVVYFQQYELMAYAYGFPEFRIPMATLANANVLIPGFADRTWTAAE